MDTAPCAKFPYAVWLSVPIAREGIEPPTRGFSGRCRGSSNRSDSAGLTILGELSRTQSLYRSIVVPLPPRRTRRRPLAPGGRARAVLPGRPLLASGGIKRGAPGHPGPALRLVRRFVGPERADDLRPRSVRLSAAAAPRVAGVPLMPAFTAPADSASTPIAMRFLCGSLGADHGRCPAAD